VFCDVLVPSFEAGTWGCIWRWYWSRE